MLEGPWDVLHISTSAPEVSIITPASKPELYPANMNRWGQHTAPAFF